jgi:hypothetical protein
MSLVNQGVRGEGKVYSTGARARGGEQVHEGDLT